MLWRPLEPFLQTRPPLLRMEHVYIDHVVSPSPFNKASCIHPCFIFYSCPVVTSNGARFFQDDHTDQRNAAGGICMNMSVVCLTSFCFSLLFPEPVALIIIIIAFTHLTLNLNFQFVSMCTVHHLCSIARTIQCRSRAVHNHAMIFIFPHPLTFFINHIPFN